MIKRGMPGHSIEGTTELIQHVELLSEPLETTDDLDPLLAEVGDARVVMLGEASHGTSEYYRWRHRITKRLVREHGFDFVVVEGDWPHCEVLNRYVKGRADGAEGARETLRAFTRWPTWMWANEEVADLAEDLRDVNRNRDRESRVGFHGLDVYSLYESLAATLEYLERTDPEAAEAARRAVECFEPYGEDPQAYAASLARWVPDTCESEVVDMLAQARMAEVPETGQDREDAFNAEQNALVAVNAERYYRALVQGDEDSWNVRDTHMTDTLERLLDFYGPDSRGVVWAHNTHVGDARATDMAAGGLVNIGQLARERLGSDNVFLVGFGSYEGSVIAGRAWGAPMERMTVPQAREGSVEQILHAGAAQNKLLLFPDPNEWSGLLAARGHRAIGVVYHPERERWGNYVPTVLPERYDAFLYLDRTQALHPLPVPVHPEEEPETWPSGL